MIVAVFPEAPDNYYHNHWTQKKGAEAPKVLLGSGWQVNHSRPVARFAGRALFGWDDLGVVVAEHRHTADRGVLSVERDVPLAEALDPRVDVDFLFHVGSLGGRSPQSVS